MKHNHRRMDTRQRGAAQAALPGVQTVFAAAVQHHLAGRLHEAEPLYRQALALNPRHADSLHLLGVAAFQTKRPGLAVEMIGRAIACNPKVAAYHSNLGNALREQGLLDEAVACFHKALDLKPELAEAHTNLGNLLADLGRLDEAVVCHRNALELQPNLQEAHTNLGKTLQKQGRLDEAVACYREVLDLRPDLAQAHFNMAAALAEQGETNDAIACDRRAVELKPDFPEAHYNLGNLLREQGQLDEAAACYRRALAMQPDFAEGHFNLALALLSLGDLAAGFEEYEWRWKTPQMINARRDFAQPQWQGEPAEGRTLLIHAEQGFGDTLQFCRYASLAAARGLRVILQVQQPLVRLLSGLPGVDLVVARGENPPPFDLHSPILSMPFALRTTLTTVPSAAAYLRAEETQIAAWRARLAARHGHGPRIGLVWAGNPFSDLSPALAAQDGRRSLAVDRLAPLFDVPGVQFISLQKDRSDARNDLPLTDFMDEMQDFGDTAALIANLDLVISVDTAVAHLAAALGKPVWMLDRFDPCWRWIAGRRDSPWYPTMRLYRQTRPGDWDPVLAEVVRDLRDLAAAPHHYPVALEISTPVAGT